ncbi:hypothetical protein K1T73_15615 [Roseovarius sp. SCSIO 43702]|uniref:sensor histidine kinase n=1 Tax=Roseovarius sp. SCSIO 43702 TaxID=2823043 RepID=UPI001C735675|nr:hypothetical protein [Roseovarius sp. SCSIO 43702]QYX56460.1 hypothetical protein K1T73_15615 [Roseovarius sp. SCSIO 43702]
MAAALTCLLTLIMLGLGVFIIHEYRTLQMHSFARIGGVHIDSLLAPIAVEHFDEYGKETAEAARQFRELARAHPELVLRIWRLDGTLALSTLEGNGETHDPEELNVALTGNSITSLETAGPVETGFPLAPPFFEVYGPIREPGTDRIVAVGEIYQDASEMLSDRAFVERTVWAATGIAFLGMLGMLGLAFRQNHELGGRLRAEARMTALNDRLRREAEQARQAAAQANEQVLNLVGAELHDGPVQLLALMSLMQDDNGRDGSAGPLPDGTTLRGLTDQAAHDLRAMAVGLILPELEDVDPAGVVTLAVERHRELTGTDVDLEMTGLPADMDMPRRICLYRVIQEGLGNAFRHGAETTPHVRLDVEGDALRIMIESGSSRDTEDETAWDGRVWHLGLQAMRRRLDAFGGAHELDLSDDKTVLRVTLPLET